MHTLAALLTLLAVASVHSSNIPEANVHHKLRKNNDAKVIILGGGVAGVIAARAFHEQGIDNFIIVEGRDELGGRLRSTLFAGKTVELGANWVQGTQTGHGPANPIFTLVKKHEVKTQFNDFTGSITTYDTTGAVNYVDVFNASVDAYVNLTIIAGNRVPRNLVDITSRTAYTLIKAQPRDSHAKAAEYYQFDWEYAQKPDQTSAIASSWANNFTFDAEQGGFSAQNLLSIDQRGFKTFIQQEAKEFLKPSQLRLNSIVKTISWSGSGVEVVLEDGSSISGAYALYI